MASPSSRSLLLASPLLLLGEGLRLWALRAIGPASRTLGDSTPALATSGPYRYGRNPLYVGNLLLHSGVAVLSASPWGMGLPALLLLQYRCIIAWEESRLREQFGATWERYQERVQRWWGRPTPREEVERERAMRETLRAERSTFLALGVGLAAFILKGLLMGA